MKIQGQARCLLEKLSMAYVSHPIAPESQTNTQKYTSTSKQLSQAGELALRLSLCPENRPVFRTQCVTTTKHNRTQLRLIITVEVHDT